eukprot:CAMPEP_0115326862 /NCGR_PEP_ID=MMETSP0270-20121206/83806_1 /TAXON_ID=71861 /ORGANISM="Scrippsiella trochoidea, Strain CCMP3099" /LENGTH=56 /DNA_ID=CAMNT_0002747211 /DNA_START=99 /DNA_END=267 /DNA_ORIENTATION=-
MTKLQSMRPQGNGAGVSKETPQTIPSDMGTHQQAVSRRKPDPEGARRQVETHPAEL